MVFQKFCGGFGDEHMDLALNSVQCDWVVGCVGGEDGDR